MILDNRRRRFGATYSRCRLYRYLLWRDWGGDGGAVLWVMLNPSTADHLGNNDATIARCERRSADWGYRRMEVVNLFALRSARPRALFKAENPVGPANDRSIRAAARRADVIVCAWGALGSLRNRARAVEAMLDDKPLSCLARTREGHPAHPLYLPYRIAPIPYCGGPE